MLRLVVLAVLVGCGARTDLGQRIDADGGLDARAVDASFPKDAPIDLGVDSPPDVESPDAPLCCEDGQNLGSPPDDLSGGASVAWEYIPSCNIDVAGIELHNAGGFVAILGDDGGQPGATLFQGTLPPPTSGTLDWVATTVSPPLPLQAGQVYWIQEAPGPLSEASSGVAYTYWAQESNGWNGPYNWHFYTSRIHGACGGH